MNAVVYAFGKHMGGNDGAREQLEVFWRRVSEIGERYNPLKALPDGGMSSLQMRFSPMFEMFKAVTHSFSPYQLNPANFNPLREVLESVVDFTAMPEIQDTKLFLTATNVRTGQPRVFRTHEVTVDAVMASACLPQLFQAVEIDGEHYWDGGYMGNPSLYPLFYHTRSRDVIILHINPIERDEIPMTSGEIYNRVNEISFNSALIKELRAVAFVQKLQDDGALKPEFESKYKYVLIHSIRADAVLGDLSVATKFDTGWEFLTMLRDRGRATAAEWHARHRNDIGVRSTVDLRAEFLQSGGENDAVPPLLAKPRRAKG
jgi:NTE family protein